MRAMHDFVKHDESRFLIRKFLQKISVPFDDLAIRASCLAMRISNNIRQTH